jgi:hypothetical protein
MRKHSNSSKKATWKALGENSTRWDLFLKSLNNEVETERAHGNGQKKYS